MRPSSSSIDTPREHGGRSLLRLLRNGSPVIVVLVLGCLLRVIYLEADPNYYAWTGYITDEGRWVKSARNLALFGHVLDHERALHVHLAPLFHLAHTVVFKLFGVSFLTARLLTAVSGCALLLVAGIFLRRVATGPALMVALMLLAFEVDLIAMSRVAIPEMPSMVFQLAAFAVILTPPAHARRMVLAGVWLLLAVATKATVVAVVPIFGALVVLVTRARLRRRLGNLCMFGVGLGAPVVPVVLLWLTRSGQLENRSLQDTARVIRNFLAPSAPYDIAALLFESTLAPLFNLWGLAACLAFVGWIVSSRTARSSTVHDCYVGSLIWFGAYSVVMMSLAYFPERYRIHLLVPLALNVAAGLTLFQEAGVTGATEALRRMPVTRRLVALTVLGLPTAAFAAPLLASGYHLIGGETGHLRVKIAAVAVALLLTAGILDRRLRRGLSLFPFVVIPVTAALSWLISDRLGLPGFPFWPAPEHGAWTWTLGVGWMVFPVAWALAGLLTQRAQPWRLRLIPVAAAVYAALSLVRVLPSYVAPQYTMKQASENLGRELAGFQGAVGTRRAESLFNANTLRYRNAPTRGQWQPEALVVASFDPPDARLEGEYRLVTQYDLFISPLYVLPPKGGAVVPPSRLPVRVYLRQPARTGHPAAGGPGALP